MSSLGGEIPGSVVFIKESQFGPRAHRFPGFAIGLIFMSMTLGNALATGLDYGLSHYLSPDMMRLWGWRVPFMCGFFIGIVSFILRKNAVETVDFIHAKNHQLLARAPLLQLFRTEKKSLLIGFCDTVLVAALVAFRH
jgi:predicted MFS family arabinose efflux permease